MNYDWYVEAVRLIYEEYGFAAAEAFVDISSEVADEDLRDALWLVAWGMESKKERGRSSKGRAEDF